MTHGCIVRHAIEPGTQGCNVAHGSDICPNLDPDFLQHVPGVFFRAHHPADIVKQPPFPQPRQRRECGAVSPVTPQQQELELYFPDTSHSLKSLNLSRCLTRASGDFRRAWDRSIVDALRGDWVQSERACAGLGLKLRPGGDFFDHRDSDGQKALSNYCLIT